MLAIVDVLGVDTVRVSCIRDNFRSVVDAEYGASAESLQGLFSQSEIKRRRLEHTYTRCFIPSRVRDLELEEEVDPSPNKTNLFFNVLREQSLVQTKA